MARTLQVESINSSSTGLDLQTLGSSRLFINSSGNVGIGLGAVSPNYPLDIAFSNTALPTTGGGSIIRLCNTDTTTSSTSSILFTGYDAGGANRHGAAISWIKTGSWTSGGNNYGSALIFSTRADAGNTVEYVRITSSGNVGIGTTSPAAKLEVSGRIRITASSDPALEIHNGTTIKGYLYHDTTGPDSINLRHANATASQFVLKSDGNVGIGTTSPATKLNIQGTVGAANATWAGGSDVLLLSNNGSFSEQAISFKEDGSNVGAKIGVKNTANGAYDIIFANRANTSSGSSITEKMRINSLGNVGIGTTNPLDQLHVSGTSRILLSDGTTVATDSTAGIYFHTAGSTSYAIHRTAGAWTAGTYQQLRIAFDTGIVMYGGTDHANSFVRVDGTGIRVATGNIGIGTTTKALSYKLDVYGTNYTDCVRIAGSSSSSAIDFFDSSSGSLARKGMIYTNSEGIGILNSAAAWALRVNHGTYDVVIPSGSLTLGKDIITNANYGYGLVGVYPGAADKFQSVYAMSTSYTMKADGSSLSAGAGGNNFYGIAWSHPNAAGQAANLVNHGALIVVNGITQVALSDSIWCRQNITAYSDERVKTNWRDFDNNFVFKLAKVKSGIYDRTDQDKEKGTLTQVGVSAQSLREVIPDAVTCNSEGMLSVSYGNAAMASCVELAKEILKLKEEIAKIKENK